MNLNIEIVPVEEPEKLAKIEQLTPLNVLREREAVHHIQELNVAVHDERLNLTT